MADECDVSEIITVFLLNTCRLHQRVSKRDVEAAIICGTTATGHPQDDKEGAVIPLITGGVAEFYIEPMLPLVGDIIIVSSMY